jgi:serine/threonine protein kinase/WD40 repeat protein
MPATNNSIESDDAPRTVTLPAKSDDDGYARLLEEISERLQAGSPIDLEAYRRAYPQYDDQLVQLLPAMQMLVGLGDASDANRSAPLFDSNSAVEPTPFLIGDFRIVREVGRGGMGVVYEAEQISLRRRVALKVLPFAAMLDARQLARFQTEARAAAGLHHTAIVPVFSVGCERGVHYYAMQFIEGHTLAAVIEELRKADREKPKSQKRNWQADVGDPNRVPTPESPDPKAAVASGSLADTVPDSAAAMLTDRSTNKYTYYRAVAQLAVQAADGLAYAHQHGVIHRDVKPANLMLDAVRNLWVTDFGLARLEGDAGMTMTGDVLGTLRYMSPEQARGDQLAIDSRTDVYSLGATIYELMTLEPIFAGADRQDILRKVLSDEPRMPRQHNKNIPRELETIVLKAVAKSPGQRYQSMDDLAEDLKRFLENKPVLARRAGPLERTQRWISRNPMLATLVGLLTMLAVVSPVVAINQAVLASNESQAREDADRNAGEATQAAERERLAREEIQRRIAQIQERDETLRLHLYRAHMVELQDSWNAGHVARCIELLERYRPRPGEKDVRGFEWYHWWRCCHDGLRQNFGIRHYSEVVFSPDGKWMAVSWRDENGAYLGVYDVQSLELNFQVPQSDLPRITFTADSRRLISGHTTNVSVREIPGGREIEDLPSGGKEPFTYLAISHDGNTIAIFGYQGENLLWDVATATAKVRWRQNELPKGMLRAFAQWAAFARDDKTIATMSRNVINVKSKNVNNIKQEIKLFDAATGAEVHVAPASFVMRPGGFSSDGTHFAYAEGNAVKFLRSAALGEAPRVLDVGEPVTAIAYGFRPNLLTVRSGTTGIIRDLDPKTGELVSEGVRGVLGPVAFCPDSIHLAELAPVEAEFPGSDSHRSELLVRNHQWLRAVEMVKSRDPNKSAMIAASSGREFAVARVDRDNPNIDGNTPLDVWSLGETAATHRAELRLGSKRFAFSHEGGFVGVSFPGKVELLNLSDGSSRARRNIHDRFSGPVAFSSKANLMAVTRYGKLTSIELWELCNPPVLRAELGGHPLSGQDAAVALSFLGHKRETGLGVAGMSNLVFSPDGKTLASTEPGSDHCVRLWDVEKRKLKAELRGHRMWLYSLAFSRDGRILVSAGHDRTVRLWNVADGTPLATFGGHNSKIKSVAFSPDGKTLASADSSPEIRLWHVPTRDIIATLSEGKSPYCSVAFSADSKTLLAGNENGDVFLWRGATEAEVK